MRHARCHKIPPVLLSAVLLAASAAAEIKDVPHPFLLWTRQEAADIGQRLEADAVAKKQLAQMEALELGKKGTCKPLLNMFKYTVLGDKTAGEAEKKELLRFIGARPPGSAPGNPATLNAPWRDDRTLDALRYDVLYDELTPEQRKGVEDTIRYYVKWHLDCKGPWTRRPRVGWLPNMQWPTAIGIHLLAAASKDEELIKQMFSSSGGWKWFFDVYVGDGRFYMEEFGKYYSNIGGMVLWCQALERLGLDALGWGYSGRNGANMRNFLEMLMWIGFPRIDRPGGTADYATIHMGDAGALYILNGYQSDGTGGTLWWRQSMMNGPIPKMAQPLWWEAGCKKFPDGGFGYFLAQLRKPGEEVYLPTLYFGLKPIDPAKVKPPSVRSYFAPDRGFAMLRMEESPAYWESPKPAVAVQFAMYYMHYVHDCLSILQYVADNRFIYTRLGSVIQGYAGGDPCRDSTRGQASAVTVDSLQIQPVDNGEEGCANQRIRSNFSPAAKFVAVHPRPRTIEQKDQDGNVRTIEKALYPGVDAERAWVLTDDYLFDVYWLVSDRPRVYDWHVQGGGQVLGADAEPWRESAELGGGKFWPANLTTDRGRTAPDPTQVRKKELGAAACLETVVQKGEGDDAAGVRVRLLPAGAATSLYVLALPATDAQRQFTLMARRSAPRVVFAALHEPFKDGVKGALVERFDRIAEDDAGIAVAVIGRKNSGINDRIIVRTGPDAAKPGTYTDGQESFTVSDYAWVRIGPDAVEVVGQLTALKLKVKGSPKLVLNGQETPAQVKSGRLEFPAPSP